MLHELMTLSKFWKNTDNIAQIIKYCWSLHLLIKTLINLCGIESDKQDCLLSKLLVDQYIEDP